MIKKALIIGIVSFIIVFGLFYAQNMIGGGKKSDTSDILLNQWKEKAHLLAQIVSEGVSDEDDIVTGILLNQVKNNFKESKYITIITNNGIILADFDTTKVLETYTGPRVTGRLTKITPQGQLIDIGTPVIWGDEKVGEVHIGLKSEAIYGKKEETPFTRYLMFSGIAFVLMFLISIPLTKGGQRVTEVSTGLETLTEETEKLKEAVNNLRQEEENLIKALDEKRKELQEIENQIKQKQEDMKSIDEEWQNIGEKRMQVEELRSELSKLTVELEDKKKELEEVKKAIEEGKTAVSTAKSEEEALLDSVVSESNIDARIEEKKRQEVELTQRIVAKRREEIALSARVEAKRKELIELERKIEELKGKQQG